MCRMQLEKVLLAGPWVGEFGWELFCWQGYIRALSRHYDKTICIAPAHSKFLYDDFCDQFLDFTPDTGDYKDSFYKVGFNLDSALMKEFFKRAKIDTSKDRVSVFTPRRIGDPPRTHYTQSFRFGEHDIAPIYIKLGSKTQSKRKTVIVHARSRNLRPTDNWPTKKWEVLVASLSKMGYNVISIGLKHESLHIEGTEDKRECDSTELLNTLSSAKCIFGPSSGAMHLATLCECPQVVWTTNYNFERYTKNWNPLNTPVLFLSKQGRQPSPEYVIKEFETWNTKLQQSDDKNENS